MPSGSGLHESAGGAGRPYGPRKAETLLRDVMYLNRLSSSLNLHDRANPIARRALDLIEALRKEVMALHDERAAAAEDSLDEREDVPEVMSHPRTSSLPRRPAMKRRRISLEAEEVAPSSPSKRSA